MSAQLMLAQDWADYKKRVGYLQGLSTAIDMLDKAAVSYNMVLTKADKIKATELQDVTERTIAEARKRPAAHPDIIATSSEKGMGVAELRAAVIEAIG